MRRDVLAHRTNLRFDQRRIKIGNVCHAPRVLHGKQRDHRLAVDRMLMKRFEVCLKSRSPGRIGTCNRERDENHGMMVHAMRRLAIQGSVTTLLACALICACGHEAETHAARDAGHVSQPVAPVLPDAGPTFITHTVEEGETLWDIAQAYGIRSRAILVANHLDARDVRRLAPGMTLRIPGATSSVEVATARDRIAARETERAALPPLTDGAYYTLVRGDTLSEVAEEP